MKPQSVTRFRNKNGVWEKAVYQKAFVFEKTLKTDESGARRGEAVVRILTPTSLDIACDDYLLVGEQSGDKPNQSAMRIAAVCENLCGSERLRHIKLICR